MNAIKSAAADHSLVRSVLYPTKGLTIVKRFSMISPLCISSEYKIVQPASNAEATILASYGCNEYCLYNNNALATTLSFSACIKDAAINPFTKFKALVFSSLCFFKETLRHSKTTCGLMK